MKLLSFSTILSFLVMSAGCATPPASTPTPRATPVMSNAAWTPQIEVFEGVEMVLVPAGCFLMGSDVGRRDERPEHEICFEGAFWIDRYEVTNAQYGQAGNFQGDQRPRENLTWFEARDFCIQRSGRLPTEAEWEYAAAGPDNLNYPWGDELSAENIVFDQNNNNETATVASKPDGVSWVGAHDMAGNVLEWTSSIYQPYPYDPTDGREDPDDSTSERVYRSSINSYIDFAAASFRRFRATPETRDWFIGFRCARDEG